MASTNQTREAADKARARENDHRRVSSGERLNVYAEPGKLRTALARKGVRLTRQRRAFAGLLDMTQAHPDPRPIAALEPDTENKVRNHTEISSLTPQYKRV